jgi:hypothetical protein
MLVYSARRKNAISFSFFSPYQTSSTENVWNCLLRLNIWKLSSRLRNSCSVFIFFWSTSTSQKCQTFQAPKNVSIEFQQFFYARIYPLSISDSPVWSVWKIKEILRFHNKCSTHFGSFSFHWSFPMHIGWEMLGNWGFSKKWPIKRHRGEKHIIEGHFLTKICVFWAIIHENWSTGLGCTLGKESKNAEKSHSTRTCHYYVETPLLIWSKLKFAGLVYPVT